jgi:hypothetical protein
MGASRSCKSLLYIFGYDLHPKVFVHDALLGFMIVLLCPFNHLEKRYNFSMFSVWYNSLTGYSSWSTIILKFLLFASWCLW